METNMREAHHVPPDEKNRMNNRILGTIAMICEDKTVPRSPASRAWSSWPAGSAPTQSCGGCGRLERASGAGRCCWFSSSVSYWH